MLKVVSLKHFKNVQIILVQMVQIRCFPFLHIIFHPISSHFVWASFFVNILKCWTLSVSCENELWWIVKGLLNDFYFRCFSAFGYIHNHNMKNENGDAYTYKYKIIEWQKHIDFNLDFFQWKLGIPVKLFILNGLFFCMRSTVYHFYRLTLSFLYLTVTF